MLSIKYIDSKIEYIINEETQINLPDNQNFQKLFIIDFNKNIEFSKIMDTVIQHRIKTNSLVLTENEFGGNIYCDSLIKFIRFSENNLKTIEIQDQENCVSNSDLARLNPFAKNISITLPNESLLVYQGPVDDSKVNYYYKQSVGFKLSKNINFSCFFNNEIGKISSPKDLLKNFFSIYHQQRTNVTCAAACVVMIMEYYNSLFEGMNKSKNSLIKIDAHFRKIFKEAKLEKLFETNNDGTDVNTMDSALSKLGFHVTHSMGITETDDKKMRDELKKQLVNFKNLLHVGVPVIVNYLLKMGTNKEEGHFSVIISIDDDKVVLADPSTRFDGKVQPIEMSIGELIGSWRSETGNIPGKYFVLFPNQVIKEQMLPELQVTNTNATTVGYPPVTTTTTNTTTTTTDANFLMSTMKF